jgi:hypothetical protein
MMSSSTLTDRSAWDVKDEAVHAELIELMDLSDEDVAHLTALVGEAEAAAPDLSSAFYERLMAHENTREYFEGQDMDARHRMVEDWFVDLFRGSYDESYVSERLHIGHVHVKIGLPVRYPLAMLDVVSEFGREVAGQSADPDAARRAFQKVLSVDIAVFNQAYEDNQLKHLAELVGGERLARRLLTGGM